LQIQRLPTVSFRTPAGLQFDARQTGALSHIRHLATASIFRIRRRSTGVVYFPHMAPKKTTLKELGEMLTHVVEHMATKEDIANVLVQLTSVERELKSIRRDLDDLREKVENVIGFQKEIDHALERIAAIEKHLGINKKIAA
jgi:hypothetical protein